MNSKRHAFSERSCDDGVEVAELAAVTRNKMQEWLRSRGAQPGETVEFEWLVFNACETPSGIDVKSLDFEKMASFTLDLRPALRALLQQREFMTAHGFESEPCRMVDLANVCESYVPGQPGAFLMRCGPLDESGDSGWIVGTVAEGVTERSLEKSRLMTLYEVTISDPRLARFWLLPSEYTVMLHAESYELIPPGTDLDFVEDFEPPKPWWKFW